MQKFFRSSIFLALLFLMIIGAGQSHNQTASATPEFDPACLFTCQQLNLDCFFGAVTKSDQHKCTAEYRRCIAHCK